MSDVSVVIPCYNARLFIGEALGSVFSQSRAPKEIIVVDDGSTDGSAEEAERLGVRVIRTGIHKGVAAARNTGLHAARGDLVAWLDADDYWESDHLATVVPLLERFPEAVLAFSLVRMFGSENGVWPAWLPAEVPVSAMSASLRRCVPPQNALVLRRAQVLAVGGYDERLRVAEDYDLWLRLAAEYTFICTHRITCNWRRHGAQSSKNMEEYWSCEYASRGRFREAVATRWAPSDVTAIDEEMRMVWKEHLDTAWHGRQARHYDFHLGKADQVPGAQDLLPKYLRRRYLIPIARIFDASPQPLRMLARVIRRILLRREEGSP